MDLAELTFEVAKTHEGTTFQVAASDGVHALRLDQVLPYELHGRRPRRGPVPKRAPFSLYFVDTSAVLLPQGMYTFTSPALTLTGMFIVPIGRDEQAIEYEAVFT